ncbi:immunoglobulin J chain [Varanus komodoensis]|uniref:Joining chain of multimeric IgA and IgM n=1 Tax=Varanus komodoensis TaxID=61221 RepID=A0A8D2Q8Z4_VARKO|nr:immunoglobulin J chain [Varanus komodoensis]
MQSSWILCGALALFGGAILGSAFYGLEEAEEKVLVDNKCQCVKMTSRFVPSKDNPEEEVLERNIRIFVPLKARENITDPTSPLRTRFVYNFSKLCNRCDSDLNQGHNLQKVVMGESTMCNDPDTPCYTFDRNKCYTASCLFSSGGKVESIMTALTPESCYDD